MRKARVDQLKSYPRFSGDPAQPFQSFWNAYKAAMKEAGVQKHQRTPWVRACCTGEAHRYAQNNIWNQPDADWRSWKKAMQASSFDLHKTQDEAIEDLRRIRQRGRSLNDYTKEQEALHVFLPKEGKNN